jgi:AraC family transcriptional regulator
MAWLGAGEFYGRSERRLSEGGTVATALTHSGRRRLPAHGHSAAFFSLLVRGDYREDVAGQTLDHAPLTLMFHPPDTHHRDEVGPRGATFFTLEPAADLMSWLRPGRATRSIGLDGIEPILAFRAYQTMAQGQLTPLALESLTLDLVARVWAAHRRDDRHPAWLARIEQRLRDEVTAPSSIGALAAAAGVHPVHLARAFRQRHGMTIAAWRAEQRLSRARRLLAGDLPLAAIALQLGFADQAHFTRVFTRRTGTTPGRLRATLRHLESRK